VSSPSISVEIQFIVSLTSACCSGNEEKEKIHLEMKELLDKKGNKI